jgi:rieske iron-sulfur protein
MQTRNDRCAPCYGRRAVLGPVFALALAPLLVGVARAEDEPEKTDAAKLPPQPGDRFVFLTGPNKGQVVRLDNLAMGGPQVQVFPAGPGGTVRDGTPLNLVILARFDPAELGDETRERAAEGVVAYSAVVEGARWVCLLLPRLGL